MISRHARTLSAAHLSGVLALVAVAPFAAPAMAQQTPRATAALEEIVVTARRREENLQTVPVAVQAFNAEMLKEQLVLSGEDLVRNVPSLYAGSFQRNLPIGINLRGVPGVRLYFAEAPTGSLAGAGPLFDISSVQVLPGPQGTLFGLSATGGAILIEPARPTDRLEANLAVEIGSKGKRLFEGMLNVPIVQDKVLLRLAGNRGVRDGFIKELDNGKDLSDEDYWNWRVGLTVKPFENFENYLMYRGSHSHTNGTGKVFIGYDPAGLTARIYGVAAVQALFADQQALGPHTIRATSQNQPIDYSLTGVITDVARLDFSDTLAAKFVGSYTMPGKSFFRSDHDGTPLLVADENASVQQAQRGWTGELQLLGKLFDNKVDWQAGYYVAYSETSPGTRNTVITNLRNNFGALSGQQSAISAARTNAVFAQATADLAALSDGLQGLKFTAGFRYNWDFRSAQSFGRGANGLCTNPLADSTCRREISGSWKAPGYTLSLDYQVAPSTLLYVTTRRGYGSGGFNPSIALPQYQSVDPEYVTDVELGIKTDWQLGALRGRTNAAVYYDWYTNIQKGTGIIFTDASGRLVITTGTTNAAKARIAGWELQNTVSYEGLSLRATAAYIAPWYTSWPNPTAAGTIDQSGFPFVGFSRWKISLTPRYVLPLDPSLGEVSVGANIAYTSHAPREAANFSPTVTKRNYIIPGYTLVDLQADWRGIAGYPLDLTLYAKNVTNKLYDLGGLAGAFAALGFYSTTFGDPRLYGARLTYHFNP